MKTSTLFENVRKMESLKLSREAQIDQSGGSGEERSWGIGSKVQQLYFWEIAEIFGWEVMLDYTWTKAQGFKKWKASWSWSWGGCTVLKGEKKRPIPDQYVSLDMDLVVGSQYSIVNQL